MRPIAADELEVFAGADAVAFGAAVDPRALENLRAVLDLSRSRAVFDGDRLVAASGSIGFELTLPGLM